MDLNEVGAVTAFKAKEDFLRKNGDLVACGRGGATEIFNRIQADWATDDETEEAMRDKERELTVGETVGDALIHSNRVVQSTARAFLQAEAYKQICLSFLKLRQRGAIVYAITLTDEASEQEYQVEVDAGCRLPAQRQAQAQTATEDLTTEVTLDWNGRLTTAQIQAKKKLSTQYGARLDAMLNEGMLS